MRLIFGVSKIGTERHGIPHIVLTVGVTEIILKYLKFLCSSNCNSKVLKYFWFICCQ
jgi:hypothetical protein